MNKINLQLKFWKDKISGIQLKPTTQNTYNSYFPSTFAQDAIKIKPKKK